MKKAFLMGLITIIGFVQTARANSTVMSTGLDYYYVPQDVLLFHVAYPYDFVLYILAFIGLSWICYRVVYWLGELFSAH